MDLTGVWIGETLGETTPLHHWIIVQDNQALDIYTRWEGENTFDNGRTFKALIGANNLFKIRLFRRDAYGVVLNEDSFKVLHWKYGWRDGKQIPLFDVLFQRCNTGLQRFEIEFLLRLYEDKAVLKRLTHLPYA
jgi:hypothetical protein